MNVRNTVDVHMGHMHVHHAVITDVHVGKYINKSNISLPKYINV